MTRSPLASLTAALRTRKSRDGLFSRRIEGKDDQSMSAKSETRDFLWFLAKLAVFVFVLRSFIVSPFNIPSESMQPPLLIGDYLLVAEWPYGRSEGRRVGKECVSACKSRGW